MRIVSKHKYLDSARTSFREVILEIPLRTCKVWISKDRTNYVKLHFKDFLRTVAELLGTTWISALTASLIRFKVLSVCNFIEMFQHNKKCFTIESLVGKDANSSTSGDEPIRPTALRLTESVHPAPFGTCFQNSGRTLYSSPEMMFQDPGAHATNPALSLHHLQIPSQHFFSPHQRDTLNFYPWVLRNRYLGHRFQG